MGGDPLIVADELFLGARVVYLAQRGIAGYPSEGPFSSVSKPLFAIELKSHFLAFFKIWKIDPLLHRSKPNISSCCISQTFWIELI